MQFIFSFSFLPKFRRIFQALLKIYCWFHFIYWFACSSAYMILNCCIKKTHVYIFTTDDLPPTSMLITRYHARWRFGAVAREFTRDLPWQIDPTSDSWSYRQLVCPSFIFKVFFVVYLNYGNEFHCIFIYLYFSNKIDCSNEMSPMKIEDTWETLNRSCAVHLHCSLCLLFWLKAIGYIVKYRCRICQIVL